MKHPLWVNVSPQWLIKGQPSNSHNNKCTTILIKFNTCPDKLFIAMDQTKFGSYEFEIKDWFSLSFLFPFHKCLFSFSVSFHSFACYLEEENSLPWTPATIPPLNLMAATEQLFWWMSSYWVVFLFTNGIWFNKLNLCSISVQISTDSAFQ